MKKSLLTSGIILKFPKKFCDKDQKSIELSEKLNELKTEHEVLKLNKNCFIKKQRYPHFNKSH